MEDPTSGNRALFNATQTEVASGSSGDMNREGADEDPTSGNWAMHHATQIEVSSGGSDDMNREGTRWKTLRLATGLCVMSHKSEKPELAVRKFLRLQHN